MNVYLFDITLINVLIPSYLKCKHQIRSQNNTLQLRQITSVSSYYGGGYAEMHDFFGNVFLSAYLTVQVVATSLNLFNNLMIVCVCF